MGVQVACLADPASVGEVLPHGCCAAGAWLGGGGSGGDFEVLRAADCVADVTGQAVGGDDAEPGAGDDRDAGSLGALVQVVQGAEHLQLVADVEVVHSRAQAGFGERGRGVQERAGGVQDQVHAGQRGGQRGRVVQGQSPVRQVEALGQRGDGGRAAAGEQGPVTALVVRAGRSGRRCRRRRRRASRSGAPLMAASSR